MTNELTTDEVTIIPILDDQYEGINQTLHSTTKIHNSITPEFNYTEYEQDIQITSQTVYINDTRNIGITITNKGTMQLEPNYITVIIPQHIGKYKRHIKNLLELTETTITSTTMTLQGIKQKFKETPFENVTKHSRDRLCAQSIEDQKESEIADLPSLCKQYVYNSIVKQILTSNKELFKTTNERIRRLENRFNEMTTAFTRPPKTVDKRSTDEPGIFDFIGEWEKDTFNMATQNDIQTLREGIDQLELSESTLKSALNQSVVYSDWTKTRVIAIETAVKQLQTIAVSIGTKLRNEIDIKKQDINPKLITNIAEVTITSTTFISINNVCTDLENEIQRISNIIQNSINGHLNTDAITPLTLYEALEDFKTRVFAQTEKLLWKTDDHIINIYKEAKVQIYRCQNGKKLMITFRVPIMNTDTSTEIKEINILPFNPIANSSQKMIINLTQTEHQLHVINLNDNLYYINNNDILKNQKHHNSFTYPKDILIPIDQNSQKCLKHIIELENDEIIKHCGIRKSEKNIVITKTNSSFYTYSTRRIAEIKLSCPTLNINRRVVHHTRQIIGYGNIIVPEHCDLITPIGTYIGDPIEITKLILLPTTFHTISIENNNKLDTTLWKTILTNQKAIEIRDLIKVVKHINEMELLNDTNYDNETKLIKNQIIMKLIEAEVHLSNTRQLMNTLNRPVQFTIMSIIVMSSVILLLILCICRKFRNKSITIQTPKYPKIQPINPDEYNKPLLDINTKLKKHLTTEIPKSW